MLSDGISPAFSLSLSLLFTMLVTEGVKNALASGATRVVPRKHRSPHRVEMYRPCRKSPSSTVSGQYHCLLEQGGKKSPKSPKKVENAKKKRSTLVQLELTHLSESLQLNVGVLISVCRGVRVLMSVPHWPTQQYHTWSFDGEHRPAKASRVCMCGLP